MRKGLTASIELRMRLGVMPGCAFTSSLSSASMPKVDPVPTLNQTENMMLSEYTCM